MRTYLDRVGPTYYFRRVVPEHLRPYFWTDTGKPRTEFKISLRTKDRREADRLVELKAVEISAQIAAAQRKYDAGIPPTGKSGVDDTLERYEEIQLEAEAKASRSQFEAEQEEAALIDGLAAPVQELSPEQRAIRRLLPSELFDPPEVQAAREARRAREADEAAKIVAAEFKAGTLGKPKYQLDKILDRYTEVVKPTAATLKKWRTAIAHLKAFLKHDAADRITQQDIIRWRDALLREGRSVETVRNNYLGAVKAVLQVAVEEGVISTNPIKDVRVRQEKRPQLRGKDFTPAEAATILRATLGDHSGMPRDTRGKCVLQPASKNHWSA